MKDDFDRLPFRACRRRRRAASLLAGLVSFVACAPSSARSPIFDANVETAKWIQLWRTYDLDIVEDLFVTDSTVTYLSSEREGLILGFDSLIAHHEGFGFVAGGSPPAGELWLEAVHGTRRGEVATVTAVWFFGDRAAPRDSVQRGPVTFVYTWDVAAWRIAHVQFGNY